MQFTYLPICAVSLFAAFVPNSASALNPDYDFKIVAISSQTIGTSAPFAVGGPLLNDRGEVVIIGQFGGYPLAAGQVLFTPERELFRTGDTIEGHTINMIYGVNLNDRGEVVFLGSWNGTQYPGGVQFGFINLNFKKVLVENLATIDGLELFGLSSSSLNDRGELLISSGYMDQSGSTNSGLFTPHRILVKAGSVVDGYTLASISHGTVDSSGTVFFVAASGNSPTGPYYLFTQHRLLVKPGDFIGGVPITGLISPVSASSQGNVAFLGLSSAFPVTNGVPSGLFALRSDPNEHTLRRYLIAKPGDTVGSLQIQTISQQGSISNAGEVSFVANTSTTNPFESYIFLDKIERDRHEFGRRETEHIVALAGTGDSIDGQTLSVVNAPVMNDSGVIGFSVTLADGQTAVVIATPKLPMGR